MSQIFYKNKLNKKDDNSEEIDENIINKFNIINLFGKETLEDVQEKISKATGLAFVTVDYKGEPITKMTSFTEFCCEIRRKEETVCNCKASDAFGGIQAAVTQKNCIYFCPCGLLEIAIPIIVRGHYLGAFIGGQVRCIDAPVEVTKLENIINYSNEYLEDIKIKKLFNSTCLYEYEKFVGIANLISLIINQLAEKEVFRLMQKTSLKKEIGKINDHNKYLQIESNLQKNEFINLKAQLNPYFIVNILNSISNLAIIEDAPKTNEMAILFAKYLRQSLCINKKYNTIEEEFENVEKYLRIQQIKYGELLNYSINIEDGMNIQKIPSNIIIPFVENAIFYGIASKKQGGKVNIDVRYEEENEIVITIIDNGPGYNPKVLAEKFKLYRDEYEGEAINLGIENSIQKIKTLFGEKYGAFIEHIKNKGTRSIIRYPRTFDERNV